jgi:hypothetical protein
MKPTVLYAIFLTFLALTPLANAAKAPHRYQATFKLKLDVSRKIGIGEISLGAGSAKVVSLTLQMPQSRYSMVHADGDLRPNGDVMVWRPPAAGGRLRYRVQINEPTNSGSFRAVINSNYAIFRGDDVFPAAKVRTKGKAESISELIILKPKSWSAETPFERGANRRFQVTISGRRFDRPVGWMIAGDIACRIDNISNMNVSVCAPKGDGMRRQDMLSFLNYNVPYLAKAFGKLPPRLLIVSAPDPMWRGGLSAPNSLFMHLDRPLISENGTSTILHELTHVFTRIHGKPGADWIAESLAEFYAIEILHRSGGATPERYLKTKKDLESWSSEVKKLNVAHSTGPITARGVLLLMQLDAEIAAQSKGKKSLDDVTRLLMPMHKITNADLASAAQKVLGRAAQSLQTPVLAN